ncbi:chromatin modification- protein VID21 [Lobulomyces angularis]|nr:chromatin modification- protein VID21 [Lobulomyces angularis]
MESKRNELLLKKSQQLKKIELRRYTELKSLFQLSQHDFLELDDFIQNYIKKNNVKTSEPKDLYLKKKNLLNNKNNVIEVVPGPKESKLDINGYQLNAFHMNLNQNSVSNILQNSKKVVLTRDWQLAREEYKYVKLHHRVEHMKSIGLWSFRQILAHVAPERPKAHQDFLLDEMKWLSEDFKQERKWKIAAAYNISRSVMEYHNASDKSIHCVKVKPPNFLTSDDKEYIKVNCQIEEETNINMEDVYSCSDIAISIDPKYIFANPFSNTYFFDYSANDHNKDSDSESKVYRPFKKRRLDRDSDEEEMYQDIFNKNKRVVEVSSLMMEKTFSNLSNRWDDFGRIQSFSPWLKNIKDGNNFSVVPLDELSLEDDSEILVLNGDEKFDHKVILSPFVSPDNSKELEIRPPTPPPTENEEAIEDKMDIMKEENTEQPETAPLKKETPEWTIEEDEYLIKHCKLFQYNWKLISTTLNTKKNQFSLRNVYQRNKLECYNRYMHLKNEKKDIVTVKEENAKPDLENGTNYNGDNDYNNTTNDANNNSVTNIQTNTNTNSNNLLKKEKIKKKKYLTEKKLEKFFAHFDIIHKFAKKRDNVKLSVNKKLSLAAHDTHLSSQTNAGIILGGNTLGPLEVTALKERRETEAKIREMETQRLYLHCGRPMMMPYGLQQYPMLRPPQQPAGLNGQPVGGNVRPNYNNQMRPQQLPNNYTTEQLKYHQMRMIQMQVQQQNQNPMGSQPNQQLMQGVLRNTSGHMYQGPVGPGRPPMPPNQQQQIQLNNQLNNFNNQIINDPANPNFLLQQRYLQLQQQQSLQQLQQMHQQNLVKNNNGSNPNLTTTSGPNVNTTSSIENASTPAVSTPVITAEELMVTSPEEEKVVEEKTEKVEKNDK